MSEQMQLLRRRLGAFVDEATEAITDCSVTRDLIRRSEDFCAEAMGAMIAADRQGDEEESADARSLYDTAEVVFEALRDAMVGAGTTGPGQAGAQELGHRLH